MPDLVGVEISDNTRKFMKAQKVLVTALLAFLVVANAGILSVPAVSRGMDFATFYRAGFVANTGHLASIYDRRAQESVVHPPDLGDTKPGYFYHPVFEVFLFRPFAFLPYKLGFACWTMVTVFLMLVAGRLVQGRLSKSHSILLTFAFFPTLTLLWLGQDSAWLLILIVLAYRAFMRKHDWICGLLISLTLFKFQYAIPLIVLLSFRRRWSVIKSFSLGAVALLISSWTMIGTAGFLSFWRILNDHGYELSKRMFNVRGLVDIFGGHPVITIAVSLTLVVWYGLRITTDCRYFAGAIGIAVLISYHGQNYDGVLLLAPIMTAFSAGERWPALFFFSPLYFILAQYDMLALISLPIFVLAWRLSQSPNLHGPADQSSLGSAFTPARMEPRSNSGSVTIEEYRSSTGPKARWRWLLLKILSPITYRVITRCVRF